LWLTEDVVAGIKSIKCLCWESIFQEKIMDYRNEEFKWLKKAKYLDMLCVLIWSITSITIITATFMVYNWMGYNMGDTNLFTVMNFI
jgi:hypothetical protein